MIEAANKYSATDAAFGVHDIPLGLVIFDSDNPQAWVLLEDQNPGTPPR